jgi:hypothetical protein
MGSAPFVGADSFIRSFMRSCGMLIVVMKAAEDGPNDECVRVRERVGCQSGMIEG